MAGLICPQRLRASWDRTRLVSFWPFGRPGAAKPEAGSWALTRVVGGLIESVTESFGRRLHVHICESLCRPDKLIDNTMFEA